MIIAIALLGALINRLRGGSLVNLSWRLKLIPRGEEGFVKCFAKNLNDFVFASTFSLLLDASFDLLGLWCFASLFVGMRAGRSVGWGVYIEDLISKTVSRRTEVFFIDYLFLREINHPILRNAAALSTRGLLWSISLAAAFYPFSENALWIAPLGLFMSPCYLLAMNIWELIDPSKRGLGWGFGEMIWGAVLWGSCATILLGA